MQLRKQFQENMKKQDFFFWKRNIEKTTNSSELWEEIHKLDAEIKLLQKRRDMLGTSAVIIGNNILRKKLL